MSGHYYYCPFCGDQKFPNDVFCNLCKNRITPVASINESTYYIEKASKTDGKNFWIILKEEEISKNPRYDPTIFSRIEEIEAEYQLKNKNKVENMVNTHIPKCPTCESTNITKISTGSKIAGAAMFGLLSKTAKSQFKCNNCGYKW